VSRSARIAICDYGIGNLGSVLKAFRHVGAPAFLASDPRELLAADALVLPGDGAFGASMSELVARGQHDVVRAFAAEGRPVLGICIGMQLLFDESDEHGRHRGLGLLPGRVERLPDTVRVPHMGWNVLERRRPHEVLQDLAGGDYVYFVHSYACRADDDVVLATTDYGGPVAAVVGRGSVLGMQFHPEKSQAVGLRLVARFAEIAARAAAPALAAGGSR
jgi:imidazole glycerol-phosphate synthase subunit HisH